MNYQPYEDGMQQEPYGGENAVKKNARYYRARAREVLKNNYGIALGAMLLASLLGAMNAAFSLDISLDSEDLKTLQSVGSLMSLSFLRFLIVAALGGAVVSVLFSLLVGSPVKLGYQSFCLDLIDRKPARIERLFTYFKTAYTKSIGLNALHSLIVFACQLPLTVVGAALLFIHRDAFFALMQGEFTVSFLMTAMLCAGICSIVAILVAVLQIWVEYRFYYCFMILAEYPEMRVIDALRSSANLMRGHKWQLFCLQFSFIGWIFLGALCCGIGVLFVLPYIYTAEAAFYDDIARRNASKDVEFPSLDPDDYNSDDYFAK